MKNLVAAALAAGLAVACSGGIGHTKVSSLSESLKVRGDLAGIGNISGLRAANGNLYVAGKTGIAALDAGGDVLWLLQLPKAAFRLIEADQAGVSFTSFNTAGVEEETGVKGFLLGNLGDKPKFQDQTVGAVSAGGKLLWSVPINGETAASAPAMSAGLIAVSRGKGLFAYARTDGREVFKVSLAGDDNTGLTEGLVLQSSFNRPVFAFGGIFAGHLNHLIKVDPRGKVIDDSRGFGLFSAFEDITVAPIVFKGRIIMGNSPMTKKATVFGVEKEGTGSGWKEYLNDAKSGVGSLATNSNTLFVASNFHLAAYSEGGGQKWEQANGKGGLYPGTHRGLRFAGGTFPTRKAFGEQMVADEKNVYITSAYHEGDAITVLDARSGQYVESIDVGARVVDMAIVGSSIALATLDGLRFVALR